jgi:hypothetical protein
MASSAYMVVNDCYSFFRIRALAPAANAGTGHVELRGH